MPMTSREIRLASRPNGEPAAENFAFAAVELPDPQPGEVLVRNLYLSVDPYMRSRMNDAKSYVPPFEVGKVMTGGAVGRVVASADEKLPVGTHVLSMYGWREAFVVPASHLQPIDVSLAPPAAYLGILGVTGFTAWLGLFRVAKLQDGETLFVSGGAGAVGSAACQFARMRGCHVLASAGTDEKVAFLRDELKVDFAFHYLKGQPLGYLKKGAPDGLHVYFDNTMGPQLEAAIYCMRDFGRIVLCGGIAGYNTPVPGPRNLTLAVAKRLRMEGFIVSDWFKEMPSFLAEAIPAYKSGKLISRETVVEGLDAAPVAFMDLLRSGARNIGKVVIKLAD